MNCISPYSDSTACSPSPTDSFDGGGTERRSYVSLEKQDPVLARNEIKNLNQMSNSPMQTASDTMGREEAVSPSISTMATATPSPTIFGKNRYRQRESFDDELGTPLTDEMSDLRIISPSVSSSLASRAVTPTVNNTSATRGHSFVEDQSSLMNTMNLVSSEEDDSGDESDIERGELEALRSSPPAHRYSNTSSANNSYTKPPLQRRPSPKIRQFPYDRDSLRTSANSEEVPKHYNPAYWNQRLARPEVYSRRYRPNDAEKDELLKLEEFLGIPEARRSRKNIIVQQWRLINPSSTQASNQNIPQSIVLKRGPVCWGSYDECELILLTRGFVVARKVFHYSPKFQLGEIWTNVDRVGVTGITSFTIECTDQQKQLDFSCPTALEMQAWMKALRIVVIQAHTHQTSLLDTEEGIEKEQGWQYKIVQAPWFTEAVTGQVQLEPDMLDAMDNSTINTLDSYNNWTPLHYAVRGNNIDAMRFLLQSGADPNKLDGMGVSPIQYGK